ncbi:hypothetical protein D4R86_04955 [bacterium]|nr:MAG: hypothetical protein D4R86_04955 [bacterium]
MNNLQNNLNNQKPTKTKISNKLCFCCEFLRKIWKDKKKIIIGVGIGTILVVSGILVWQFWPDIFSPKSTPGTLNNRTKQLTLESIKNTEYYCKPCNANIQLADGHYVKKFPDSASVLNIKIFNDMVAFGDLNDDGIQDAAVILDSSEGGSGHFYELAVLANTNGEPLYLDSAIIGDRVVINSMTIQSGVIILDIITHGLNDALCCPTTEKIIRYELSGNQLVKILDNETVDWKTYTNTEYGFEIKYPSSWNITKDALQKIGEYGTASKSLEIVGNSAIEVPKLYLWVNPLGFGVNPPDIVYELILNKENKIEIKNREEIPQTEENLNVDKQTIIFCKTAELGTNMYAIEFVFDEEDEGIKTFNQILSTFKFVD